MTHVLKEFDHLNTTDQVDFLSLLKYIQEGDYASVAKIGGVSSVQIILETCEPYILEKLPLLMVDEMIDTLLAFSHPHVAKRFSVVSKMERVLINTPLDFEQASHLLFECSS